MDLIAEPERRPDIGTAVVSVRYRRWRVLGLGFGPAVEVMVRVIIDADSRSRCERVDGRPLGEVELRGREQLAAAASRLLREYREQRHTTSRLLRGEGAPGPGTQRGTRAGLAAMHQARREAQAAGHDRGAAGELAPTDCTACVGEGERRPPSAVFRCDRKEITDRISRLRAGEPPPARAGIAAPAPAVALPAIPPPPATAPPPPDTATRRREAQKQAIAEMAAIREQRWRTARQGAAQDELVPSDPPVAPLPSPEKTTSSVFRCDRQEITDRIVRLRTRTPAEGTLVEDELAPPPG